MNEEKALDLKRKLKSEAIRRFPKDKERQQAYVFGTLRKLGWKPKEK